MKKLFTLALCLFALAATVTVTGCAGSSSAPAKTGGTTGGSAK